MVASATALFSLKSWLSVGFDAYSLFIIFLQHIQCCLFGVFLSIGCVKFSPCFASPRITQGCSLDFIEDGLLRSGILENAGCSEAQVRQNLKIEVVEVVRGRFCALAGPPPGPCLPQGRSPRVRAQPPARLWPAARLAVSGHRPAVRPA